MHRRAADRSLAVIGSDRAGSWILKQRTGDYAGLDKRDVTPGGTESNGELFTWRGRATMNRMLPVNMIN